MLLRRGEAEEGPAFPPRRTVPTIAQDAPQQVRNARHELRSVLHDWREPEQVDAAVLTVSEMLTNVLVHTDADAMLSAEVLGRPGARRLRIEVAVRPCSATAAPPTGAAAGGVGGRVGVSPRGKGRSIWFDPYEASAAR